MNDAQYRKMLSTLRAKISIIENNLREKDYTFDYSKQPSKAMFKYRKAFMRNDGDRYDEFMSRVAAVSYTHLDVYKRQHKGCYCHSFLHRGPLNPGFPELPL